MFYMHLLYLSFFFFNDTATTEIYTLSLHDALPISHVVGVVQERRLYPRAALRLPLRLKRVAGQREPVPVTLVTKNISSSGVYFLCPRWIEPGTPIELEVGLVDRPLGRGSVRMTTAAHIVRVEPADTPGWHGVAATFDDITFQRDEQVPPRFQKP